MKPVKHYVLQGASKIDVNDCETTITELAYLARMFDNDVALDNWMDGKAQEEEDAYHRAALLTGNTVYYFTNPPKDKDIWMAMAKKIRDLYTHITSHILVPFF